MVAIPMRRDPTLEAIDRILEADNASQPRRNYIGASSIGDECSRRIWYRYKSPLPDVFSADTIRKFNDGHSCEARMAELLSFVSGVALWTIDGNGEQYGFKDENFAGHFDGVIQGILQAPATFHVWEHKAVNEKRFKEFKELAIEDEKKALQRWDQTYYAQAVVYMHYAELDRHYLTVSTPGLRDYWSCRTEANPEFAEALRTKAKRIAAADQPPERISKTPDYWVCKMCNRREECWASNSAAS